MKKYILDKSNASLKNINFVVTGLICFGFIYFQKRIGTFIETYLMADPAYNVSLLKVFIWLICITAVVKIGRKIIWQKYMPSHSEYFFAGAVFVIVLYYRLDLNGEHWNLHELFSSKSISIKYLDMLLVSISLFFIFNGIRHIRSANAKREPNNFLLGDDPVDSKDLDKLDHHAVAVKLKDMLLKEQHDKSISIGLIGPWGNGKSSIIEMVKKNLENSKPFEKNELITVHFLPYLNHSENDIINEFFSSLSSELALYNGKLSNQIIDYASKLTDAYQNKSIGSFLEGQLTNFSKYSANELYTSINEMLKVVNKKIVVFIDDLDRLNQKEILQTLKLIRNTANFRNTIFVVAMDKDYVIKRLTEDRNILDTKFVDKFFQLEIYLPLIDSNILKNYFIEELTRPFSPSPSDFKERVYAALNDEALLFDEYIRNFRDAKRAVNQIKFDITLFQEDFSYLNLKDFINFTFFKLKFPDVITQLNINKGQYLHIDSHNQTYNLTVEEDNDPNREIDFAKMLSREEISSISHLSKYQIYKKILAEDQLPKSEMPLNLIERKILIKTLAHLFGDENQIEAQNSIRYVNNFQMLMEQRIFSNFFKQSEFENLYTCSRYTLKMELEKIHNEKKTKQLLERLVFIETEKDNQKLQRIIEYLIIIYEKYSIYGQYDMDTYKLIDKFINLLHENWNTGEGGDYHAWINQNIFSSAGIDPATRLMLLGTIWKLRHFGAKWHLADAYIKEKTAELYQAYLKTFDSVLWETGQYHTYAIYHQIKDIEKPQINELLIAFWKRNEIELLCAQITDLDSFSSTAFKISPTTIEIFGSTAKFVEFIGLHKDRTKPAIKEFLNFFKLQQFVNFSVSLKYEFKTSSLIAERIEYWKTLPGNVIAVDKNDPLQVILKINDENFGYELEQKISGIQPMYAQTFISEGSFIMLLYIHHSDKSAGFTDFISTAALLRPSTALPYNKKTIKENSIITITAKLQIEVISIMPTKNKIKYNKYIKP